MHISQVIFATITHWIKAKRLCKKLLYENTLLLPINIVIKILNTILTYSGIFFVVNTLDRTIP